MQTFPTPTPVNLRVELQMGECHIRAEQTETTTVELEAAHGDSHAQDLIERTTVEQRGDEIVVLVPKAKGSLFGRKGEIEVTLVVPAGSNIDIEVGAADLDTIGPLGRAKIRSGSGEVSLDDVTHVDCKTGSGDVRIGTARGSVTSRTGSADLEVVQTSGDVDFLTGSGDIKVIDITGALRGKAGSGDVEVTRAGSLVDILLGSGDLDVRRIESGRLQAKTGSGDVSVGVAAGTAAYLDIMTGSGETRSSLQAADRPDGDDTTVELTIRTGSGDVDLQHA